MFEGKTILITGGTGTFGKAFIQGLLTENVSFKKLIIFSRDEHKQYVLNDQLKDVRVEFVIGDIRDEKALHRVCVGVDYVLHAAALKQVHLAEKNGIEFIKTNVLGTQNVIEATIDNKVKKLVAISTDKACSPIGLYGATKLCAERLLINASTSGTAMVNIRSGNIMGSRGSILELLQSKSDTSRIEITNKGMTRFAMWPKDIYHVVKEAFEEVSGGTILVPKLPSFRLGQLITSMYPQAIIVETGVRRGEKMHEELISEEERHDVIEKERYYLIIENTNESDLNEAYRSDKNEAWMTFDKLNEYISVDSGVN